MIQLPHCSAPSRVKPRGFHPALGMWGLRHLPSCPAGIPQISHQLQEPGCSFRIPKKPVRDSGADSLTLLWRETWSPEAGPNSPYEDLLSLTLLTLGGRVWSQLNSPRANWLGCGGHQKWPEILGQKCSWWKLKPFHFVKGWTTKALCLAHCIFLIRIWACASEHLCYGNQHGPKGGCIGHLMTCILKYSHGPRKAMVVLLTKQEPRWH